MQKTTRIDKRMKKRNKDINLRWLGYGYKLAKKYGLAKDLIDWESLDWSLTYSEWKTELIKLLLNNGGTEPIDIGKVVEEESDRYEQQVNLQEQERVKEEFEKAIGRIKETDSAELDKYFRAVKELIKITVKGNNNGLILLSNGGLGKTFTVLKTLSELNMKISEDFIYINSYITSLELYHILHQNQDKLIILDDVERLLEELKNVGILKGAMWESAKGLRIINYYSSSEKLKAPMSFEFKGKLILCMNKVPNKNREVIDSLLSRAITYKIDFSYDELIKIYYELAKILKISFKIIDFIKENSSEATDLNLRTLIQASTIYDYYKKNPDTLNGCAWQVIVRDMLFKNTNLEKQLVVELMRSNKTVKEQVMEFVERSGYSRRTFFRIKKELVSKCQVPII